jgi:hypothetical protein
MSDDLPPMPNDRWTERLILIVALLAGLIAMSRNLADADLWGHVTFGMNVLQTGQFPETATHTYAANGYTWINHENLSEITLAAVTRAGGGVGLLAFKCMLGAVVLGAIVWAARRQSASVMAICILVTMVAANLSPAWTLRPQLSSYVFCTLMILCLNAAFARFDRDNEIRVRYLWCVVALLFFWANSHGGFVAGYGIFSLYMIGRSVQALRRSGRRALLRVWRLALITICGGLATLINPYGPNLHFWLLESLGQPRPEITEWAALTIGDEKFWGFAAAAALAIASLVTTRQRRDIVHIVVLAVTAWQSISHARHIPFFAILLGFWLPQHLDSLIARLASLRTRPTEPQLDASPVMMRTALTALCLLLFATLVYRSRELHVDKSEFPVNAIEFMARNDLNGRLVVTYNWAQYALAALGPETTVGFDGRFRTCYPQAIVDMHFDFIYGNSQLQRWRSPNSPAPIAHNVLHLGDPDLALVDRAQEPSVTTIAQHPDWVLLFQDARAQVWGHRARFDDPAHVSYLPPDQRSIKEGAPHGVARWPAFPNSKSA